MKADDDSKTKAQLKSEKKMRKKAAMSVSSVAEKRNSAVGSELIASDAGAGDAGVDAAADSGAVGETRRRRRSQRLSVRQELDSAVAAADYIDAENTAAESVTVKHELVLSQHDIKQQQRQQRDIKSDSELSEQLKHVKQEVCHILNLSSCVYWSWTVHYNKNRLIDGLLYTFVALS